VPNVNVTVRGLVVRGNCTSPGPCTGSGTWADGINIHGAHRNILVEDCAINHTGDDTYAIWSAGDKESDVTFRGNRATLPRYPRTWLASCFAVYGGNRSAFVNNQCVGTGERGMIFFDNGFHGLFAPNASSTVLNNTQDDLHKPICGGMSFPNKVVNAPGWGGGGAGGGRGG
jgi:hypothetical protein